MARSARHSALETRTGRARLKRSKHPYSVKVRKGLYVDYYKGAAGGSWSGRKLIEGTKKYGPFPIGLADDQQDANNIDVFDFFQAQDKARKYADDAAHVAAGMVRGGRYTVADALVDYLTWADGNTKTSADARTRANALIIPKLGTIAIDRLSSERIERWLADLANQPARIRTRKGESQKFKVDDGPDVLRRRRASANRTYTILRAALNRAFERNRVASNAAWKRVKPFRDADAARPAYLSVDETTRLINASPGAFKTLVQAGAMTGARYSELATMRARDFDRDAGTAYVQASKSNKARHIVLTDEGIALYEQAATGKAPTDLLFTRDDGRAWEKNFQVRPTLEACERAKIHPPVGFHVLRHTYASLSIMGGVPLLNVAKNLGHADTRMVEKHYGHLAPSYHADQIRAGAPRFGTITPGNVTQLQGRKKRHR